MHLGRDFADKVRSYMECRAGAHPLPRPGYAPRSEARESHPSRLGVVVSAGTDPVPSPFRERVREREDPRHKLSEKDSCAYANGTAAPACRRALAGMARSYREPPHDTVGASHAREPTPGVPPVPRKTQLRPQKSPRKRAFSCRDETQAAASSSFCPCSHRPVIFHCCSSTPGPNSWEPPRLSARPWK